MGPAAEVSVAGRDGLEGHLVDSEDVAVAFELVAGCDGVVGAVAQHLRAEGEREIEVPPDDVQRAVATDQ